MLTTEEPRLLDQSTSSLPQSVSNPLDVAIRELRRHFRALVVVPLSVGIVAVVLALLLPAQFDAEAIFAPAADLTSGLAGPLQTIAQQFGIAGAGSGYTVYYFAQILQSREVLQRVARDTLTTDGKRWAVLDELGVDRSDPLPKQIDAAVRSLGDNVSVNTDDQSNLVTVDAQASSPARAEALVRDLLTALDTVVTKTVESGAGAERRFADAQTADAAASLATAEDDYRAFLERNRMGVASSPDLLFEDSRLRRRVEIAQSLYIALQNQAEAAKLQEVHNTPSISLLQPPQASPKKVSPKASMWGPFGVIAAGMVMIGWIYGLRPYLPLRKRRGLVRPPRSTLEAV